MKCRVPEPKTQCGMLLRVLKGGARLTTGYALMKYGVYALSQRCGELRKMGWPVVSEWYKTLNGARVKRYWLQR